MNLQRFREAMAQHLGQVITPDIAAAIEQAAFERDDRSVDPLQFAPSSYRSVTFRVERLRDIVAEIHPLHQQHYAETEKHRHGISMDPDYDAMLTAERRGELIQCTARDSDGRLVGNIRIYLHRSMHTRTLFATEDTFYLRPEARAGWLGLKFWRYMEAVMRQLGVLEIRTDSKIINQVNKLNEFCGYTHVSNGYVKFLKG